MQIEFDPVKDSANQTKHRVSLALAEELDWDAALVRTVRLRRPAAQLIRWNP